MRRNKGWAFVAWVHDGDGGRRQVWRGGFPTKAGALSAERRFLVEAEDGANQVPDAPAPAPSPTLEAFLVDWLEHSASIGAALDLTACVPMNGDGLPEGWALERVREIGQPRDEPRLLDRSTKVTLDTPTGLREVEPSIVLECGGLVLVLDASEGDWLMGQQSEDGSIVCWGSYGDDLESALRGL